MKAHLLRKAGRLNLFKRSAAAMLLAFSLIASAPRSSYAASDDEVEHYDGRIQGYTPDVELKSSAVGLTWMVLLAMGVVCLSVVFKDAKRSHLD